MQLRFTSTDPQKEFHFNEKTTFWIFTDYTGYPNVIIECTGISIYPHSAESIMIKADNSTCVIIKSSQVEINTVSDNFFNIKIA